MYRVNIRSADCIIVSLFSSGSRGRGIMHHGFYEMGLTMDLRECLAASLKVRGGTLAWMWEMYSDLSPLPRIRRLV